MSRGDRLMRTGAPKASDREGRDECYGRAATGLRAGAAGHLRRDLSERGIAARFIRPSDGSFTFRSVFDGPAARQASNL